MVGSRPPLKDPPEANKQFVPACAVKGAIGIYGKAREPVQMDANKQEFSQTQAGPEVKVYLKAKTYD